MYPRLITGSIHLAEVQAKQRHCNSTKDHQPANRDYRGARFSQRGNAQTPRLTLGFPRVGPAAEAGNILVRTGNPATP